MYDMYLIDSLGRYALMTDECFGTVFIRRYATAMFYSLVPWTNVHG